MDRSPREMLIFTENLKEYMSEEEYIDIVTGINTFLN